MENQHQSLPKSGGLNYVIENARRALRDLCMRDIPYRQRILDACSNAHRPGDNELFTAFMSDATLVYWRKCSILRFDKRAEELSEDDIAEMAESLMAYLYAIARDNGIVLMGGDPRRFQPYDDEENGDEGTEKPIRNP